MAGSGLFNRVAIPGPFEEKPVVDWGWRDSELTKDKVVQERSEVIKAPVRDVPRPEPVEPVKLQPEPERVKPAPEQRKFLGNERRVSILSVEVTGARLNACNGIFKFDGLHQQKPLFKADSGAIIYFNGFWKINGVFKTSSWMYSNQSKSSLPPEGEWTLEGSSGTTAGAAPRVKLLDETFRSLGPQGASLRLQGGQSVLKREENKSWRWIDVPIYAESASAEDGIESLEALCARLEREEAEDSAELNFGLLAPDESPTSAATSNGYYSFDMIRQMGQELMAQTASSSAQNGATNEPGPPGPPGPPWPLETPGVSLGERLRRSNAESRRGDSGNLLRARLHF